MPLDREAASFRDPSGFVYYRDGDLLRQVNPSYQEDYKLLNSSGLYEELVKRRQIVSHTEEDLSRRATDEAVAVIKPQLIPFISYPYEWCFSQLKDAALLTLEIQTLALKHGMTLKDANAYNIQFIGTRPVIIDTLSFEKYEAGAPWIAYRQFCQHFLAPLVLASTVDLRLERLGELFADGVPLSLASQLAPKKTRWKVGLALHLHAHARAEQSRATPSSQPQRTQSMGEKGMLGLLDNLAGTVRGLSLESKKTIWSNYYDETNYTDQAMARKRELVGEFLDLIQPKPHLVVDLGANTGEFSKIATSKGMYAVASDMDAMCIEHGYLEAKKEKSENFLSLVQDLTNPSPSVGWGLQERKSFIERGPAGAILALALVHHLAIGNNVPLSSVAELFARLGEWAIVEFVPKEDSQTQRLLSSRKDVFPNYHLEGFEASFAPSFEIVRKAEIAGTKRTLFLMKRG